MNRERRRKYIDDNSEGFDNIAFYLLNEFVVKLLEEELGDEIPRKSIDPTKDEAWNRKMLASRILRGILNGDSIPQIAKSLLGVVTNNEKSSKRIARTVMTECENKGRLASYRDLDDQGVVQKKQWLATPDSRTRESHVEIDGEERDIDDRFSNDLMYPGDPTGEPKEVYNCRCTMTDRIVGFRRKDGSISYVEGKQERTTHEPQMEEERRRRRG